MRDRPRLPTSNGDGTKDLLSRTHLDIVLRSGLGGGQFGPAQVIATSTDLDPGTISIRDLISADLDRDGDEDIVCLFDGRPVWLQNLGQASLTSPTYMDPAATDFARIRPADADADGDLDLFFEVTQTQGHVTGRIENLNEAFSPYCSPAVANSSGAPAILRVSGSKVVTDNNLTLTADSLPTHSFGYFLNSQTQSLVPAAGGSQGTLCLGGSVGRYSASILYSGAAGTYSLMLDLNVTPQPNGAVAVIAGETWNFQCWYRDSLFGTPVSNFTDAVAVRFQ